MLLRACPKLSGRHECPNQSLEAPPFFGVPGRGTERTGLPEQRRLDLRQAGSCLLHRPRSIHSARQCGQGVRAGSP